MGNIDVLCDQLNFGKVLEPATPLLGGALHKMWKAITSTGTYCIKEINPYVSNKSEFPKNYELSEAVANQFKTSCDAVVAAVSFNDKYVQEVNGSFYIIYEFIIASYIDVNVVQSSHTKKVGAIFANFHNRNLQVTGFDKPAYINFSNEYWQELIKDSNINYLQQLLSRIIDWNTQYKEIISEISANSVITHGDLHYKNVLWDTQNQPHIIDWESAGLMNPDMEVIGYGLEWSGILKGFYNKNIMSVLLSEYRQQRIFDKRKEINIKLAFYGWLGHCVLGWTEFNTRRMLGRVGGEKAEINMGRDIIENLMSQALQFLATEENMIIAHLESIISQSE